MYVLSVDNCNNFFGQKSREETEFKIQNTSILIFSNHILLMSYSTLYILFNNKHVNNKWVIYNKIIYRNIIYDIN